MDIIKFKNPSSPTKMEHGEIINGIKNKLWIERYDQAGEFTLKANVSSGLKDNLPIGSFISHVKTQEIMIVENHEINENQDTEAEIIVSGRGFETFLENRIVGSDFYGTSQVDEFRGVGLPFDYSWNNAIKLLRDHIIAFYLIHDECAIPYVTVDSIVDKLAEKAYRRIPVGTLYERLLELLAIDYVGVKIIRPGPWSPLYNSPETDNLLIRLHIGNDLATSVVFSNDTGEVLNADYLWSNKTLKTSAYVAGKWVETLVELEGMKTGYSRRMMFVDASDIDGTLDQAPVIDSPQFNEIVAEMQQRGRDVLKSQVGVVLTKPEISSIGIKPKYRTDFNVGDLITVIGDYNIVSKMRITEYVEIEDETGEFEYPVLSLDNVIFPETTTVIIEEDSMLFKTGSVSFAGQSGINAMSAEILFGTAFPSTDYKILFGETVVSNSDTWNEIEGVHPRASNKTATGFRISIAVPPSGTQEHILRIDWLAILSNNAEGEISEL